MAACSAFPLSILNARPRCRRAGAQILPSVPRPSRPCSAPTSEPTDIGANSPAHRGARRTCHDRPDPNPTAAPLPASELAWVAPGSSSSSPRSIGCRTVPADCWQKSRHLLFVKFCVQQLAHRAFGLVDRIEHSSDDGCHDFSSMSRTGKAALLDAAASPRRNKGGYNLIVFARALPGLIIAASGPDWSIGASFAAGLETGASVCGRRKSR